MTTFTNTGEIPLQVPGFNNIPLDFELPSSSRFAHGLIDYRHSPRLTKREMAILRLLQSITEKPGWNTAVLSPHEAQLAEWYREATEGPEGFLVSPPVWDWCLAELADKARHWQATGRILVFDCPSAVCQADVSKLLGGSMSLEDLQNQIATLGRQEDHDSSLVDPSLFPLIFDRTPVLVNGGQVNWAKLWEMKGEVADEVPAHPFDKINRRTRYVSRREGFGGGQESCYPNQIQWLPCEVEFVCSGDETCEVRIASYMNNLHPDRNQTLYRHLERLLGSSVCSWNEVLFYANTRGRRPPRILTYGCEIHDYLKQHEIFRELYPILRWEGLCRSYEEWDTLRSAAFQYITGPELPKWKQAKPMPRLAANLLDALKPEHWDRPNEINHLARYKRSRLAWFNHPGMSIVS
ncbi:hypothetical protein BDV19DRAFT_389412 [Aspergillus venezuelensis]